MLLVYNPLKEAVKTKLSVNLYYTGLTDTATIRESESASKNFKIARDYSVDIGVKVDPESMSWFVIE